MLLSSTMSVATISSSAREELVKVRRSRRGTLVSLFPLFFCKTSAVDSVDMDGYFSGRLLSLWLLYLELASRDWIVGNCHGRFARIRVV